MISTTPPKSRTRVAKVRRAARPIAGRLLIPDENGKQMVRRPNLDPRRVEHPKITAAEHVEVGGRFAESAGLVSHFASVGELMKSLHPVVAGEGDRLRDKIRTRQRQHEAHGSAASLALLGKENVAAARPAGDGQIAFADTPSGK